MAYTRIKKKVVQSTITKKDGRKGTKKQLRYYPSITHEGRELGLGSCRTREDAESAINHARANIANGKHPKATKKSSVTIKKLWEEMLETGTKTGVWRPSTILTNTNYYNTHIKPNFENRRLSDIAKTDIQQWVTGLCKKKKANGEPLSPATIDRAYRQLKHMFNQAVDDGYIEKTPVVRIKRPPLTDDEIDCLDIEEIDKLLDTMAQRHRAYFSILAYAGLRAGEGLALKRKNIDFDQKRIQVTHSWSAANGYFEPKTKAAKRYVPMLDVLYEVLKQYCKDENFGPEDFLFKSSRTDVPVTSPFRKQLNRALAKAGLRHVSVHSFRHSYASLMIASGASIVALSKTLGHKSTKMTLDTYGHLYPQELENAIVEANGFVSRIRKHKDASS